MIHCLPSALRYAALAGLLTLLGGCAIFHPYRLPTPKPSPEFKAQQKAKERKSSFLSFGHGKKDRDKGTEAPDVEAATDVSTPTAAKVPASTASTEPRTLPERSTVRYDKQGLMKKPKLLRRRINKPAGKPFRPWHSIRHFFKFARHAKPNYSPDHRPVAPAAAPVPDAAPDAAPAPSTAPNGKP